MDAATIAVLVSTAIFVGFIIWVRMHAAKHPESSKPEPRDEKTESEEPTPSKQASRRRK